MTMPSSGSEEGSYLRLIDSCITQLKAQGLPRTCNESKEEEKTHVDDDALELGGGQDVHPLHLCPETCLRKGA